MPVFAFMPVLCFIIRYYIIKNEVLYLTTSDVVRYIKLMNKNSKKIIIGIQGGKGSFNEEACLDYCEKNKIKKFEIKYLYTSNNVLRALSQKKINRGQFAIQNSIGGTVAETVDALSKYNCKILKEFEIIINHCLLVSRGTKIDEIKTIMSHPQALAQCKSTLLEKYSDKKQVSGKGNLVDQATAAKFLSLGKIPKSTAVLASSVCAKIYPNLEILAEGLQDRKDNYTTFLFVGYRR